MITGGCLCGGVRFELDSAVGPFEFCHCNRCRKVSGAAFMAGLGVLREHFRLLRGRELIHSYEAPIIDSPPAYRVCFCSRCGSCAPDPDGESTWLELPAGLLDGDPGLRPERHIFVEHRAAWYEIDDGLPQLDAAALRALRGARTSE